MTVLNNFWKEVTNLRFWFFFQRFAGILFEVAVILAILVSFYMQLQPVYVQDGHIRGCSKKIILAMLLELSLGDYMV